MLTREIILHEQDVTNWQRARIHIRFRTRTKSWAAWKAWEYACHDWHTTNLTCFYLWHTEARDRMARGDREVIEDAILLLEVDPWFFRSGYLKSRVLHHLKKAAFTESDRLQLRTIIFRVASGRPRRELRDYCCLAQFVATPEWEQEIQRLAMSEDPRGLRYLARFLKRHRLRK